MSLPSEPGSLPGLGDAALEEGGRGLELGEREAADDDDLGDEPASRRGGKSAAAFRTISEVATDLDVPPHVLRFWESKFPQIKPLKRGGGRRYYRPEDVELLRRIRLLLYRDGYTIKGVQKLLRMPAGRAEPEAAPVPPTATPPDTPLPAPAPAAAGVAPEPAPAPAPAPAGSEPWRATLAQLIGELEAIRDQLAQG